VLFCQEGAGAEGAGAGLPRIRPARRPDATDSGAHRWPVGHASPLPAVRPRGSDPCWRSDRRPCRAALDNQARWHPARRPGRAALVFQAWCAAPNRRKPATYSSGTEAGRYRATENRPPQTCHVFVRHGGRTLPIPARTVGPWDTPRPYRPSARAAAIRAGVATGVPAGRPVGHASPLPAVRPRGSVPCWRSDRRPCRSALVFQARWHPARRPCRAALVFQARCAAPNRRRPATYSSGTEAGRYPHPDAPRRTTVDPGTPRRTTRRSRRAPSDRGTHPAPTDGPPARQRSVLA
jgi:hypothetical protein